MAKRITVVISQGQSQNPAKRQLEEDLVAALIGERGIEVVVVPHLYDLAPDGTGMLCLDGIAGDMIVVSWLYPRAAHWILNRNKILGHFGSTLLIEETDEDADEEIPEDATDKDRVADQLAIPPRTIYCLDMRVSNKTGDYIDEIRRITGEASVSTVELTSWIGGDPTKEQMDRFVQPAPGNVDAASSPSLGNGSGNGSGNGYAAPTGDDNGAEQPMVIAETTGRRWYPVIDFARCTNCMECIDFCLFGVYGVDNAETILVEQPDNCRKGCPACSRVCPENAIIFPQHKTPAIAGSPEVVGGLKIDLSKLFGAPDTDAVDVAVRERDEQLVMVGRDAVGFDIGLARRSPQNEEQPKDELDNLIDELDDFDL